MPSPLLFPSPLTHPSIFLTPDLLFLGYLSGIGGAGWTLGKQALGEAPSPGMEGCGLGLCLL